MRSVLRALLLCSFASVDPTDPPPSFCKTLIVTIDSEAMLDRVIADVLDGNSGTRTVNSAGRTWLHSVEVISRTHEDRAVVIRAGRAWIGSLFPQLGVGAEMVDEDDDLAYKEKELRKLCRALRAYLEGGGDITQRRRFFGQGSTLELAIKVDGFEWCFGRRSWVWANPV